MKNFRLIRSAVAAAALLIGCGQAIAWNPDEALKDPVLEKRARSISGGLRCLVCQNQSIDDSDADLAHDLRVLVRERLAAGDTDEQVFNYLVARYGEFVLLKPRIGANTYLLWGLPGAFLLLGGAALFFGNRKSRISRPLPALTDSEKEQLAKIVQGQ
jgi:cytochrome c-type biogenesis protein CcmH